MKQGTDKKNVAMILLAMWRQGKEIVALKGGWREGKQAWESGNKTKLHKKKRLIK